MTAAAARSTRIATRSTAWRPSGRSCRCGRSCSPTSARPSASSPRWPGDGPGILLESVERSERWGRYSFVAGDPAAILVVDDGGVHLQRRRAGPAHRGAVAPADAARSAPRRRCTGCARRGSTASRRSPAGLMGYASYEAATLLDGHPAPHADEAPCPADRVARSIDRAVVFDHWRQRLVLVVARAARRLRRRRSRALEELADEGRAAPALPAAAAPARRASSDGEAEHGRRRLPPDRRRASRSTSSPATSSRRSRRGGSSFPAPDGGLPIYRRLRVSNPAPYMFYLRALGMELAGSSPEPLVRVEGRRVADAADRRDPPARAHRGARPPARARAARRPEGAGRARDARRPRTQRPRARLRPGHRPPHRADGGRAVLEGDAHRVDGRGRPPPGHGALRRARGDVPGRDRHRRAEAPGDGADRRARADARGARTPGPSATSRSRATSTSASRSERRSSRTDRASIQTGAGVVADSDPETELRETKAKAAALLPAVAPTDGGACHDPRRRSLRLVHLQPRPADREPRALRRRREVRRAARGRARAR